MGGLRQGCRRHGAVDILVQVDAVLLELALQVFHAGVLLEVGDFLAEFIEFGLKGWALSRYSGCWVGMKCITDNVESSASVAVGAARAPAQHRAVLQGQEGDFARARSKRHRKEWGRGGG